MDSPAPRFPHLDHFLNAYMHQDWNLFGNSVEDVLRVYALDNSPEDLKRLEGEINDLIALEGDQLEIDYYRLYPNSVLPSGWHMTVREWLRYVAIVSRTTASKPIASNRH